MLCTASDIINTMKRKQDAAAERTNKLAKLAKYAMLFSTLAIY